MTAPARSLQERLVVRGALLVLLGLCLAPLVAVVVSAFIDRGGMRGAIQTLGYARAWEALGSTVMMASEVTLVSLLVGVPLGSVFGKTDVPGRYAALLLHTLPLFLPPFLVALGTFHLFGSHGVIGGAVTSKLLFSRVGVVAVLSLCFAPVVTWLTIFGLRGVSRDLEDAALVSVSPLVTLSKVSLPLAWPSIAFGALVVFALSLSDLGVSMFLRVRGYPALVFSRLGGARYAPGEAAALAVPLVLVAALLVVVERWLAHRRRLVALSTNRQVSQSFGLGRWRWMVFLVTCAVSVVAAAPLVALAVRAMDGGYVQLSRWIGDSLGNSLISASLAALVVTALGVVLGHQLARRTLYGTLADAVALLAFLTPSAVLGVGMVTLWNHGVTMEVYSSMAILVIGLAARYAVIASRTVAAVMMQAPPVFEQAAHVFGADFVRTLIRVNVPMHRFGIVGAWLLSLVFCLRDLEGVVMFYPPGTQTLPIRIFTLEANGSESVVAALASSQVALTASLLVGLALVARRVSS